MKQNKIPGVTFLHSHPNMEQAANSYLEAFGLETHVIVDKKDYLAVIRYLKSNPYLMNEIELFMNNNQFK